MPITYHHHEPPPSSAPHALPAQREMSKPALNKNTPSIVAVTDDYSTYGENAEMWHVSVTHAGTDGDGNSWEVLVRRLEEMRTSGGPPRGVIRHDREFSTMHNALGAAAGAKLSSPLPHLPIATLSLAPEGVSEASGKRVQQQAAAYQAYLAALLSHTEAHELRPFTDFYRDSPFPVAADGAGEGPPINKQGSAATLVRVGSRSKMASSGAEQLADGGASVPLPPACTKVTLSWVDETGEHSHELPVLTPSCGMGNRVIDVRSLGSATGFFTHDPGFTSTSSCVSAITYIDGDAGVLLHRGYRISDLAEQCSFPEVAYLLIEGELPTSGELAAFERELKQHTMVHEKLISFFGGFKSDAHPMAIMVGVVGALSAFYPDACDIRKPEQRRLSAIQLLAKMPTIAACAYKYSVGEPVVYPSNGLGFAANFLRMMFATPCEEYVVNPLHARALETIFVLHADHEQNASTSTVRIASSSQASPFACVAAGIASLWGPAHGGANEAVLAMLDEIGAPENIPLFLAKAKDKNDPFRLMGFGHRVYKNYDPRAKIMQKICAEVLQTVAATRELELAKKLEEAALADDYFAARKLYPNVDFYSGIVLRALGIPRSMFTVIFAVARTVGWVAQWNESFADKNQRISRPRQLYVGVAERPFVKKQAR